MLDFFVLLFQRKKGFKLNIREDALKNKAFIALKDAYDNREKALLACKKAGGKVVGTLGCDVPDEILIAAGLLPIRVYADSEKPLTESDKYLEFSFDPIVRAQFEKLVDGTYNKLFDFVAASNSTDVVIRIYFYLREIRRLEPEKPVPPVEFIDWLFLRFMQHQMRNERTIAKFKKTVETWICKQITDEQIIAASAICNENRAALREFSELRYGKNSRITGSEALVIIGSSLFMDKADHTKLLKKLLKDAANWPVISKPRIFVTGSAHESTEFYDLVEAAGANVISEDHDWGDRHMDRDVDLELEPIAGIVDRYMLRQESSKKSFVDERVKCLVESVKKTGAQAVVFYMNVFEEAASWDYPNQRKALQAMGIPSLFLVKQAFPLRSTVEISESLVKLVSSMKGDV